MLLCNLVTLLCAICVLIGNMLEIEPCFLSLDVIIGEGQFGDVYRGTYTAPVCTVLCTANN